MYPESLFVCHQPFSTLIQSSPTMRAKLDPKDGVLIRVSLCFRYLYIGTACPSALTRYRKISDHPVRIRNLVGKSEEAFEPAVRTILRISNAHICTERDSFTGSTCIEVVPLNACFKTRLNRVGGNNRDVALVLEICLLQTAVRYE